MPIGGFLNYSGDNETQDDGPGDSYKPPSKWEEAFNIIGGLALFAIGAYFAWKLVSLYLHPPVQ